MIKTIFMLSAAIMTASVVLTACDEENEVYSGKAQLPTGTETPIPDPTAADSAVDRFSDLNVFKDSLIEANGSLSDEVRSQVHNALSVAAYSYNF